LDHIPSKFIIVPILFPRISLLTLLSLKRYFSHTFYCFNLEMYIHLELMFSKLSAFVSLEFCKHWNFLCPRY
jgi:hypothetical protein